MKRAVMIAGRVSLGAVALCMAAISTAIFVGALR